MTQLPRLLPLLMLAALGAGCAGYSYTLNDATLFSPPPLYADYRIDDVALAGCVQQAIEDGRITAAEQLENLNCSNAGIASLAGLEAFSGLRRVGFDGNTLRSLAPLGTLAKLELVQARNNRLQGVESSLCHAGKQFALAGNADLPCAEVERLRACGATLVDVPTQCAP